jgi:hypothetical protein
MHIKRPRAIPGRLAFPGWPAIPVCLLSACLMPLGGCGAKGTGSASATSGSPVIVGTANNSLPAAPPQTNVNRYSGIAVAGTAESWNWYISQPNQSYSYQPQEGAANQNNSQPSSGVFSPVGDFEYLADDLYYPFGLEGLNVEIPTGVSVFEPSFAGNPSYAIVVGVVLPDGGCLAPKGTVAIDYLQIPGTATVSKTVATDSLYASAGLSYQNGAFSYSKVEQFAIGGEGASTNTIPFVDSYCVQAYAGYGIESPPVPAAGGASNSSLMYLGASGVLAGAISGPNGSGLVGVVQPSAPIDLSAVTAGAYRGYYDQDAESIYQDPAYFGVSSKWVASPVFKQTGSSLVGGYVDFYTFEYTYPETPVSGNILIDFGAQDSAHPGLFPSASITEPNTPSCPASKLSTGPDGKTYCTFPVAALIGESYGKYVIFISGPELTTGYPLFYALVQD